MVLASGPPAPGEEPRLLEYSDYYYDLYYGDYSYEAPGLYIISHISGGFPRRQFVRQLLVRG